MARVANTARTTTYSARTTGNNGKTSKAPKATKSPKSSADMDARPDTLDGHPFYGLSLNEEQRIFRDAIWNPENKIVFCDSVAGSGKTLVAVATANLMVQYGMFDEIIYITSPCHERKQGFLSGTLEEKSKEYFAPLVDALLTIGESPDKIIKSEDMSNGKIASPYITAMTDSYIRGRNFGGSLRTIVLADESQNMTIPQLRTLLSRVCDNSLVVVTGHHRQIDLASPKLSGFTRCIEHFRDREWAQVCVLTQNYRGRVSQWADLLE